jgi:hypothetical protein
MKWQPIETAPKDGTCFIGYAENWAEEEGCPVGVFRCRDWPKGPSWSEFECVHDFEDYHGQEARLTRWMPLHDAPDD